MLEVVPRQWKVIQTVREKFTGRAGEKITQPPAPFHVIPRGHIGPSLLAMILYATYGEHQPLNRQSETYAREGVDLDVSTPAFARAGSRPTMSAPAPACCARSMS
jgi:transposase